jgi:C-terminal processing protease CtpA/Prc
MLLRELPNGWTLGLSHQRVLDTDGMLWEGRGVPVDVRVGEPATEDHDPVIEKALEILGG